MDCSPPGSSVNEIFQARLLEWAAIPFSRGSSPPRYWTCISCVGRWILYPWPTWEAPLVSWGCHNKVLQAVCLKMQFILSQFWSLEAWNQLVSRAMLPLRLSPESFLAASLHLVVTIHPWPSLACSHITLTSVSVATWPSSSVSLSSYGTFLFL